MTTVSELQLPFLDSNPAVISAFAYTNVSLLLSSSYPCFKSFARDALGPYLCASLPISQQFPSPEVSPFFLLRAMQNVHISLSDLRIYGISVSTTFSFFDLTTGVKLFDMMVDVVIGSMAVRGHENLPVIVAETGLPRSGCEMDLQ
ncbi:unnamed protein product [Arabidopsis lyrata]|uniref:Uncharacterized protein n=1 Tax=Arabidopsis lyrata subsp. lyrata TaxID=81972 RepID=D7MPW4_ARALL|nr:hypothetical protein ARALYDRAFT_916677 [Arabidopsis lyrata subsp. lyrata]CAH8277977.1 unnamed protein product [Arabidopsis lyrata]